MKKILYIAVLLTSSSIFAMQPGKREIPIDKKNKMYMAIMSPESIAMAMGAVTTYNVIHPLEVTIGGCLLFPPLVPVAILGGTVVGGKMIYDAYKNNKVNNNNNK